MARTTMRYAATGLVAFGLLAFGCASDDPGPEPGPEPTPAGNAQPSVVADLAGATAREGGVLDGRAVVLAGGPGGAYYELARTLKVAGDDRAPALIRSAGSLETLHLLAWGQGDVGLVQADVLQDPRQRAVRAALADAATPLFDEEIHVLVAPEGASDLLALAGKKVGIGGAGSGSATTAENLFRAAGVYDVELVPGAFSAHAAALKSGELAAIVAVGAQPLVSLHEAGLKVLDMGEGRDAVLAELQKINPSYRAGEISEEFGGPAKTVAIPAVLVRRAGFSGELDFGGSSDSAHPAGKSVAGGTEALPASLEGPSLTVRGPEATSRIAASGDLGQGLARATGATLVKAEGASALALLSSGQAEAALVSEDALQEALTRPESARLLAHLRLATPLVTQDLHLVQTGDATDADGLRGKGKNITVGAAGSCLSISTARILRLLRVLPEHYTGHFTAAEGSLAEVREGALAEGQTAIALGELKGYTALENGGVQTRLLLVVRRGVDDAKVGAMVSAVYANRKNLSGVDARFEGLDPAGLETLPEGLKLHPGAEAAIGGLELDSADAWE